MKGGGDDVVVRTTVAQYKRWVCLSSSNVREEMFFVMLFFCLGDLRHIFLLLLLGTKGKRREKEIPCKSS